jgi:hypothetical protein
MPEGEAENRSHVPQQKSIYKLSLPIINGIGHPT